MSARERCPHWRSVTDSSERLIRAVARGQQNVKVLAKRWVIEKSRCSEQCETCSLRAGVEAER